MAQNLEALVARLEKAVTRLEQVGGGHGGSSHQPASGGSDSASLSGFDEIVSNQLKSFLDQSHALGGDVKTIADFVQHGFQAQRVFLEIASRSKQPGNDMLQTLLADTSKQIMEATNFKDANRRSTAFNQLSAVAEGIPALGWVAMSPKPAPYIKDMVGAAQFYTNRVLKEFKDTNKAQCEWAKSYIALLEALHDYVKAVHTTGVAWNPKGEDAKPGASHSSPHVHIPPKPATTPAPASTPAGPPKGNLFGELAKGEGITSALKKVDKSQMTHKNPELRATSVVKAEEEKVPSTSGPKVAAVVAAKPPVFELQDKKWVVENQINNKTIEITDCNLKQTVYVYKCEGCTIQVKGKVNSITLDSCKKTAVVFESCLGTFELINCKSIQAQVLGKVPTVNIEKTDGAQIYLSKDSIETEIVAAKSSEMNVLVPKDDGDFIELFIPEQFKTVFDPKTKKLVTVQTDIAG